MLNHLTPPCVHLLLLRIATAEEASSSPINFKLIKQWAKTIGVVVVFGGILYMTTKLRTHQRDRKNNTTKALNRAIAKGGGNRLGGGSNIHTLKR